MKEDKVIISLTESGVLYTNCDLPTILGMCYSLLSKMSEFTDIPYNELVDDLKEINTKKENADG